MMDFRERHGIREMPCLCFLLGNLSDIAQI